MHGVLDCGVGIIVGGGTATLYNSQCVKKHHEALISSVHSHNTPQYNMTPK
jgi:hypothetical protein